MRDSYEDFKKEYLALSKINLDHYKEGQMKRRIDSFALKYKVNTYKDFIALLKKDSEAYDKCFGILPQPCAVEDTGDYHYSGFDKKIRQAS